MNYYKKPLKSRLIIFSKNNIKNISENPGVYIFFNKNKTPLYIGKAKSLKRRILSYTSSNLLQKTKMLIDETKYFSITKVTSELESLLLEAHLVHENQPRFNIQLKDDKNPLYIQITKDKYPKVLTARKKYTSNQKSLFFGPFPNSSAVKSVLTQIRKIFPYSQHKIGNKTCIYSQIGLCNPCPNFIEKLNNPNEKKEQESKYKRNIKSIKNTLSGKFTKVIQNLEKEMLLFSDNNKFEEATLIRKKIEKFNYITQPITPVNSYLKNPNLVDDIRRDELVNLNLLLSRYFKFPKILSKIECYDVSHISGEFPTASMITFINGDPDKNYYRHFKIRQKAGANDIASLKEVAGRRVKYLSSWGIPDLIIVDGGKGQTKVFYDVFNIKNINVVGLAKRNEELVIPIKIGDGIIFKQVRPDNTSLRLIQRLRDEAHRFARRYHHNLLKRYLIPK